MLTHPLLCPGVRGWIGIQRFDDQSFFGVDLIRNGRAIRLAEKAAFFEFTDEFKKNIAGTPTRKPRKTGNTLFRATRYALNHPAFEGKTLKPGKTLVEIQEELERLNEETKLAGPKTVDAAK